MPQLLGLEWDDSEARIAVASLRGNSALIEQAFSVPLRSLQSGEGGAEADLGAQIATALSARGAGHADTLVAVGRANIELRHLSLPAVPDDELPDLVHFQAMREFHEFDENWLLDYIPIESPAEGPRSVLAAAISPQLVGQIQRTCQAAGLKPRRLVLRSCAAAALFARSQPAGPTELRLLVDLLSDDADLTVMLDRRVVFLRTAHLPGDPLEQPDHVPALLGEIRRTMAAAQNQTGGRRVEAIVLCGRGEQHAAMARLIQESLETPTTLFDPFAGLALGAELRGSLPEHPGRFAPLLGMLLAEMEEAGHAIDFLHPRRRPEPPSRRAKYVAAAVAAAMLVVGYFGYVHLARSWLTSENDQLTADLKVFTEKADEARKLEAKVAEIEKWTAGDVPWLEKLDRLSENLPPAKQVMLLKLSFEAKSQGGEVKFDALADEHSTIGIIDDKLRDAVHRVVGEGSSNDTSKKYYSKRFSRSVSIGSEKK